MKNKVGVIGDLDSIIGFRALGMTVMACEDRDAANRILEQWQEESYAIVFITEPLARELGEEYLEEWRNSWLPSVVIIPSAKEEPSLGRDTLRTAVRRATGIDLLSHI
ncbi:MAG: V-type ATP synthase subunit F [Eubacteriales bacterium]|nr:V-type ATP synthase subunit F [Eubacteriales bacterium]MDD4324413.1 V-type ATP synthase subunit F [Eubacteriales bacterium]